MKTMAAFDLAVLLRDPETQPKVHVVDVRDSDRAGGHIKGSHHLPSESFLSNIDEYAVKWPKDSKIVFHCMMSQIRGPRCARAFARACKQHRGDDAPTVYILDQGFRYIAANHGSFSDIVEDFTPVRY